MDNNNYNQNQDRGTNDNASAPDLNSASGTFTNESRNTEGADLNQNTASYSNSDTGTTATGNSQSADSNSNQSADSNYDPSRNANHATGNNYGGYSQGQNGIPQNNPDHIVFGAPHAGPGNAAGGGYNNRGYAYGGYGNGNSQPGGGANDFGRGGYAGSPGYGMYGTSQGGMAKAKKEKKAASKGFVAAMVCLGIVLSGVVGYVASAFASSGGKPSSTGGTGSGISVNYVDPVSSTAKEETNAAHVNNVAGQTVVEISTEKVSTNAFYGQYVTEGAGSGVIIASQDGKSYILTCAHVVSGASKLRVTLNNANKDQFEASIIGSDSITDIAVISIDTDGLKTATIGDYSSLEVGDYVVAIGNPLGSLGGSVTDGIVSALDRSIIIDDQTYTLIQTNTAINPGNSGGGLFDKDGNLIGIVNAKSSGEQIEGIGFSIPITKAMEVADELIENGYVTGRVQLGLSLFEIASQNDYYTYWKYQRYITGYGVYIAESQSSDEFQTGDRIAAIDGVEVSSISAIKNLLLDYKVGDVVKVSVYRLDLSGKSRLVEVELTLTEKNS